jgi:hypothetical protein
MLGTIGHYAPDSHGGLEGMTFTKPGVEGTLDRQKFVGVVSTLISFLVHKGFADGPGYPGFSVVPIAVYRPIPRLGFSMEESMGKIN